ncbi:MAG TPA: M48 family metallopeptidase [Myxococcota bacterium]|nr:M48 family metallopeptidase [Myxococcota bacterium]
MQGLTIIFLAAAVARLGGELWLARRHIQHVDAHRGAVPEAFRAQVELQQHQKAAAYTVARTRLGMATDVLGLGVLLAWTVGGGLQALDTAWSGVGWGPIATGLAVILSMSFLGALIDIPVSLYRTFVLEERFGFNKTTLRLFVLDAVKGAAVALVLLTPLLALILWLMDTTGAMWWLYAWAAWSGFSLLLLWLYPALIAPLFNKFQPLTDAAVLERTQALLSRCGFASRGIFVMDGSLRSSHGNAYFTGLGKNKRVVFFDTLLKTLTLDEVEAVLAHELGHFKLHHVNKRLALSLVMSGVALASLGGLSSWPPFYTALGLARPSAHGALLLFMLVGPVFTFFVTPLGSYLSRRHEFEADDFAALHIQAQALVTGLVKLYRDNASTLTPDPLHSLFYDSHPPAAVRIAHLERAER